MSNIAEESAGLSRIPDFIQLIEVRGHIWPRRREGVKTAPLNLPGDINNSRDGNTPGVINVAFMKDAGEDMPTRAHTKVNGANFG